MSMRAEERGAVMHIKWAIGLVLALILVVMTGCGEDETIGAPMAADFVADRQKLEAQQPKPKAAPKAAAVAEASAEDETGYASAEQDYFYDPRGKRDPFRSFQFVNDDGNQGEDFGPLGDFEIGQLELQAVVWDANNPRALILDPGGRAYIIREGSQIGKNSGQVIHIGDNLVLVKETYENLAGERTTKDVELRIRLSQGG